MKRPLFISLAVFLLLSALLGLPLLAGVWLPDIISAPRHTLAEQPLANGHSFSVIQYWNHGDFYNTELLHTLPDGTLETHVLDGDASKSWSALLVVDEKRKIAAITLNDGRTKTIDW